MLRLWIFTIFSNKKSHLGTIYTIKMYAKIFLRIMDDKEGELFFIIRLSFDRYKLLYLLEWNKRLQHY